MNPLSNKGINDMNELDCKRALVLQGGRAGLTNKGINQMNELDCLREMVLRSSGGSLVPTTLIFSTQPNGAVVDEPFTTQPVVTVRDQNGATLTTYGGDVTIAKLSGSGTLSGDTTVAAVAGVATFVDLELSAADDYVLRASIASPALSVDSAEFNVDIPGTWAARLQTHNGDGVPLGLYQDVACTVPATEDFDPVAAIRGEFATGAITVVQSVEAEQGYLLHVNGTPTVQLDGVDDNYVLAASSLPSGNAAWTYFGVFAADNQDKDAFGWGANTGAGSRVGLVPSFSGNGQILTDVGVVGVSGGTVALGDYSVITGRYAGSGLSGAIIHRLNGTPASMTTIGTSEPMNVPATPLLSIGAIPTMNLYFAGAFVAALVSASALSDGNCTTVETYLADLLPPP